MLLGKLSKMEMAFQSTKVGISWLLTFICWCPDFTLDVHQCPEGRLFVPSESKKWFFKASNAEISVIMVIMSFSETSLPEKILKPTIQKPFTVTDSSSSSQIPFSLVLYLARIFECQTPTNFMLFYHTIDARFTSSAAILFQIDS